MGLVIEQLLRNTPLDDAEREICLRGIVQVATADGVQDARERAYLEKFVDEFFPEADPTDSAWSVPLSPEDLAKLSSEEARMAFLGFGYITAYVDEDFAAEEAALLEGWAKTLVTDDQRDTVITAVREFLYRRSVFAYAFRLARLDEEFAVLAANRFHVPIARAREINASVFNAVMTLRNPVAQAEAEAAEAG